MTSLTNQQDRVNLLCLLGGTPAVVTEVVFALTVLEEAQVEQLHVVTTSHGMTRKDELEGALEQLARSYPNHHVPTSENITYHVLRAEAGAELSDITSEADSVAAADQLALLVRDLIADDATPLHTSLAGGRKTMSHSLSAVMTLYARPVDVMSHVLISPAEAERCRDFYFPTPTPSRMSTYTGEVFDAHSVEVNLYRVPFVRITHAVDSRRLERLSRWSFGEQVAAASRALAARSVRIDPRQHQVYVDGELVKVSAARRAIWINILEAHMSGNTPLAAETLRENLSEQGPEVEIEQMRANLSKLRKALNETLTPARYNQLAPVNLRTEDGVKYTLEADPTSIFIGVEEPP